MRHPLNLDHAGRATMAALCFAAIALAPAVGFAQSADSMAPLSQGGVQTVRPADSMAPLPPVGVQAPRPVDSMAPLPPVGMQPAPGATDSMAPLQGPITAPVSPAVSAGISPPPMSLPPVAAACRECGVIESIREVPRSGSATGLGAVLGGIAGALVGRQIGSGGGRTAATVIGAAGGGFAGHQIEQQATSGKAYELTVRFDDGVSRTIVQDALPPDLRPGYRVRVVNGVVSAI